MPPNTARWPPNTIASPACAARPNPANSTCPWNNNSGRLPSARSGCTRRLCRSMRASLNPRQLDCVTPERPAKARTEANRSRACRSTLRRIALEHKARIEIAVERAVNGGARIERAKAPCELLDRLRLGEVALRDDQPVGEDDLLSRLGRPGQRVETADGVDDGENHLDVEFGAQRPIRGEGLQDRAGIGEPAGLDHDAPELRQPALRALGDEITQRVLQVGERVAAEAPVAEQRHVVARGAHQRVVDADAAELVDDDRGA